MPIVDGYKLEGQEAMVWVMSHIGKKHVGRLGDMAGYLQGKTFRYSVEIDAKTGQLLKLLQMPDGGMIGTMVPIIVQQQGLTAVAKFGLLPVCGDNGAVGSWRLQQVSINPAQPSQFQQEIGTKAPCASNDLEPDVLKNQSTSLVDCWCLTAHVRMCMLVLWCSQETMCFGYPEVYAAMLFECRTLTWIEAAVQNYLLPTVEDDLDPPVRIYASPELVVRNFKELR